MNVPTLLLIILFILMIIIGGERGVKSFWTLCLNFTTLLIMINLMKYQLDPIRVTVIGCIIISSITLFYINGLNKKTVSSLISVTLVVLLTILLTYRMGIDAKIQGFSNEEIDAISAFSLYIHLNFSKIVVCEILIGLLGAIIDVSISISSSMNEIYSHNISISKGTLLKSGINIGKDILGTMTNTLLFAFISGFMTLIVWFSKMHYSITYILNRKIFCAEVFQILSSGIGIVLIIPITAIITSEILFFKRSFKKSDL